MSNSSPGLALNLPADGAADAVPAWKQELNERLAATRSRRSRKKEGQATLTGLGQADVKPESRASRLAAKIAERYANAPSYSELFAADARAAATLALFPNPNIAEGTREEKTQASPAPSPVPSHDLKDGPRVDPNPDFARDSAAALRQHNSQNAVDESPSIASAMVDPALEKFLDTSSEQASDPVEEALVLPVQPLPANLIEFPRELVAVRKARPRLAEGPLCQTPEEAAHDQSQLRIFEVEPETISKKVKIEGGAAEWSSIRLDAKPHASAPPAPAASLKTAPLEDRLMAGIVDIALVLIAFALFVLVFAACTAHPPAGKPALLAAGLVLGGLFLLYQYLFFRYAEGTPGMRYAKIALCTFDDANPTRTAMRRRIFALLLSAAPLGLGFAWAWFDADHLGWHDRLTRMYQRSYS